MRLKQTKSIIKTQPILRKFSKPSSISSHLKCIICFEVFFQPRRTFCGHTFCNNCLQASLKTSPLCPFCRSKVNRKEIGFDRIAQNIIGQLEVLCPSNECPWKGQCQYLQLHFDMQCQYKRQEKKSQLNNIMKKDKKPTRQNINLNEEQDEEITQKINENIVKGSLQARARMHCKSFSNSLQATKDKQQIHKNQSIDFLQQLFQ